MINRLGHVALTAVDLTEMLEFYRDELGLELVAADSEAAFFRLGGDHHTLAIFQQDDDAGRGALDHIALQVSDGSSLRDLYRRLRSQGRTVGDGIRRAYCDTFFVRDPEGNRVELYADHEPGRNWEGQQLPSVRQPIDLTA